MKKAIIITGKFAQDPEFIYPFYRLQEDGFEVDVAIKNNETVLGVNGNKIVPTRDTQGMNPDDYDLLIIPGGARALEYIRQEQDVLDFISKFDKQGKIIGCICHGSQLLISAKIVKGRNVSAYYSIKDDINNAGAKYVDAPSVRDKNLITSPHYKYMGEWMKETLKAYHEQKKQ